MQKIFQILESAVECSNAAKGGVVGCSAVGTASSIYEVLPGNGHELSRATSSALSPSTATAKPEVDGVISDTLPDKTPILDGENRANVNTFDSLMQSKILQSIIEIYLSDVRAIQPYAREDKNIESSMVVSTQSSARENENIELSTAIAINVIDLKNNIKDFCQKLQEPSQNLLEMYLKNIQEGDQIVFDDNFLNLEELIDISTRSRDILLNGISKIDLNTLTSDEKWLLSKFSCEAPHIEVLRSSLTQKQSSETGSLISNEASNTLILHSCRQDHSTLFATTATNHGKTKEKLQKKKADICVLS